jgi:hypothetical protein
LRTVQDTQNAHNIIGDRVCQDIGRARYDKFSRFSDTTWPATVRKRDQSTGCCGNPFVDTDRCAWIVSLDV